MLLLRRPVYGRQRNRDHELALLLVILLGLAPKQSVTARHDVSLLQDRQLQQQQLPHKERQTHRHRQQRQLQQREHELQKVHRHLDEGLHQLQQRQQNQPSRRALSNGLLRQRQHAREPITKHPQNLQRMRRRGLHKILPRLGAAVQLQPSQLAGLRAIQEVMLTTSNYFWNEMTIGPTCNGLHWPGVGCDAEGMVVELRLGHFGATGTIPLALSKLTRLAVLDIHYNDITGSIPPAALKPLKNLTTIDASYNYLEGPIPFAELATISTFTHLNLSMNAMLLQTFTDSLPYLPYLKTLDLGERTIDDMSIEGKLSHFLSSLPNITYLNLENQNVAGPIPDNIGAANPQLEYLNLEGNDLDSIIPTSLWTLTNLTHLSLSFIPNDPAEQPAEGFSRLIRLASLSLTYCKMLKFPPVFNLTGLVHLSFDHTPIVESMPADITKLKKLTSLDLSNTKITEIIPLPNLTKMKRLRLEGMNHLEQSLASFTWLSSWQSLEHLNMGDALNLYGKLPYDLSKVSSLTYLRMDRVKFSMFPDPIFRLTRLKHLDLQFAQMNFTGLPHEVGDLQLLTSLTITNAGLPGTLPSTMGKLTNLARLDLSNNGIEGVFPPSLSQMQSLQELVLDGNMLRGSLPNLQKLTQLELLSLFQNHFNGEIPSSIGMVTSLTRMVLSRNNITGSIPVELGQLYALEYLALENNNISGGIENLQNIEKLNSLNICNNKFDNTAFGKVSLLTQLMYLSACENQLDGLFPRAIQKLSSLKALDLSGNNLTGPLPEPRRDVHLEDGTLNLSHNQFSGKIPASLLNSLEYLNLGSNKLEGSLPSILGSSPLKSLNVDRNHLTGQLPDFANWPSHIIWLCMSNNNFTDSIPESVSRLQNLQALLLNNNQVTGTLPESLTKLTSVTTVWLQENNLAGSLPNFFGGMTALEVLVLDQNGFTGTIPQRFCDLTNLRYLGLAENNLYGELPQSEEKPCFARMSELHSLDVSNNFLTGRVSVDFEGINPLKGGVLNLANNYFFGSNELLGAGVLYCPEDTPPSTLGADGSFSSPVTNELNQVGNLYYQQELAKVKPYSPGQASTANNCFQNITSRKCHGFSNTTQRTRSGCMAYCSLDLEAQQTTYCGGHGQCVPAPGQAGSFKCSCEEGYEAKLENGTETCVKPTSGGPPVTLILGSVCACFVALSILITICFCINRPKSEAEGIDLGVCRKYTLAEVEAATENWDEENLLGSGAFGSVYRGNGPSGESWAVKRAKVFTNDFEKEVQAVASLKHPNLVRLLGYCQVFDMQSGKQEQILIYEYVANGDLAKNLFQKQAQPLMLEERLDIAIGVARGLGYLHGFPEPIVHRDIKPDNIVLDVNRQAKVTDFGLLKKLDESGVENATRVAGTPGYVDPEYNRSANVSPKSDVYSFGIVLLEILSGRKAVEVEQPHVSHWAYAIVQANNVQDFCDKSLRRISDDIILELADVAFDCLKRPLSCRPNIEAVLLRLEDIRARYFQQRITVQGEKMHEFTEAQAPSPLDIRLEFAAVDTSSQISSDSSQISNWKAGDLAR